MRIEQELNKRNNGACELCGATSNTQVYETTSNETNIDNVILVCETCNKELDSSAISNPNHFRVLSDTMWSSVAAVQVVSYRILKKLAKQGEAWADDLLDMLYLDDEVQKWADENQDDEQSQNQEITRDSNGTQLLDGDSVTLIKDLDVKGANFTAKRGTLVKNISLTSNPEQIEGKVNGVQIVLLSCFLKKA